VPEARARQAATGADVIAQSGLADLNVIRQRAGLTPLVSVVKDDILQAILKERRVELAHEGHRWFDLRRYDMISSLGVTQPFRALWPIPQREVLTSNNVVAQNDQY
jgi:starch-binding outer membrane protein, SusD/RagB family